MHSRTMEDILANLQNREAVYVFSHGRPQPEAENYVFEEALKYEPDYIFKVEDDMQLPLGILDEMLDMDAEVVACHYPCSEHGNDAYHVRNGVFENMGLGCALIRADVFKKLEKPWFRTDVDYVWNGEELEANPSREGVDRHGGHDTYFSQQLVKIGVTPAIIETKCGQYFTDAVRKYGNKTQQMVTTWRLPDA
jgi:hypothetical protein